MLFGNIYTQEIKLC